MSHETGTRPALETVSADDSAGQFIWEAFGDVIFGPEVWERAPQEAARLIEISGLTTGALLDIGCGPGRHAREFARHGWTVTGLDRNQAILAQAIAQSAAAALQCEFVCGDARDFLRRSAYDLAISMFTSIGYSGPNGDQPVFRNVYENLNGGGKYVIDTSTRETVARHFSSARISTRDDGTMIVRRQRVADSWSRLEMQWTVVQGSTARSMAFSQQLYSAAEIRDMLRSAGFVNVCLYGDLAYAPYAEDARKVVVVCEKPHDAVS